MVGHFAVPTGRKNFKITLFLTSKMVRSTFLLTVHILFLSNPLNFLQVLIRLPSLSPTLKALFVKFTLNMPLLFTWDLQGLAMEYRKLPHVTEQIGVLGLGMGIIKDQNHSVYDTISYALAHKVNFFDLCCYYEDSFTGFKEAAQEVKRDSFYVQMHLGAVYKNGEYAFSRNLSRIQDTFEGKLNETALQYADFGFLHCIDEDKDLDLVLNKGIYDYALKLKEKGLIHHLALSTHTPHIALYALNEIKLDLLMFSINPAFDYQKGTYAYGEIKERQDLYQKAESLEVAISVMKPFAGGQLLSKENSPLGISLTVPQCISYALDKPAVVTVLPGASNLNELKGLLTYLEATAVKKTTQF